jgi:HK97 family phage major capsid protein
MDLENTITELSDAFAEFRKSLTNRVNDIEKRAERSFMAGSCGSPRGDAIAERKALATFVRKGDERELKAMSVVSDPDGGYLVTPALSDTIQQRIFDVSPLARLARRVEIGAGDAFEEPLDVGDMEAAWVAETQARPGTATPELKQVRIALNEMYAAPVVTQKLLDDARFDVGAWLESRIADRFARLEGAAFVNGDGQHKPRGLLTYNTAATADGARPWFTVQHVNTGNASGFASTNPADSLIEMVYALRAPYRANARWVMNRKTAGVIRKFKEATTNAYIWGEASAGQPATLFGFPVEFDEEFPDLGPNALPVAFGDFRAAYTVVERPGLRMLRDPFSAKPNVIFYAYRRVGGGLVNGEAVKFLRCATSG